MEESNKNLYILRGLPGSGKSTYAKKMWRGLTPARYAPPGWSPVSVSGDHFFTTLEGVYTYDSSKQGEAHAHALTYLIEALEGAAPVVVVDNTHSRLWEFRAALRLGQAFGYRSTVISLFDAGLSDRDLWYANIHGVPEEVIERMRERWEPYPLEVHVTSSDRI
jgi:predicted kinase